MPSVADRLIDRLLIRGTIESAEPAARRMRAIRVAAPPGLAWTPGQQIRLHTDGLLGPRRTYSVWDYDGTALDLRVFDHGDGPGAAWGRQAAPGQEVVFSRPEGGFTPRAGAAYHLFVGEETAAVAFGPMIRSLRGQRVFGVVEVDTPDDALPLDGVEWRHRRGAPAAGSATLVKALSELDLPPEPGVAYLAGEARAVQSARRHLVAERGWPRRNVLTKPFWTPGKKGME